MYTVEEEDVPNYGVAIATSANADNSHIITNTLETTVPVRKIWGAVAESQQEEVTVGLFRRVLNSGEEYKPVNAASQGDEEGIVVLKLNKANGWANAFTHLPVYDEEGRAYEYGVRELLIGNLPAARSPYVIHTNKDEEQENGFVISNLAEQEDLRGTKTWKDHGNAYGTRPEELKLLVYRTAEDPAPADLSKWELVDPSLYQITWTDTDKNVWSYECTNLPITTDKGVRYTYRIQEVLPASAANASYYRQTDATDRSFTNTLTEFIDVPVRKVWDDHDDALERRPESVTVALYANDREVGRAELRKTGTLRRIFTGDAGWSYVFEDLPKYDEDGVLITYRVKEVAVPDGYQVSYYPEASDETHPAENGFTVLNVGSGNLKVTKFVTGNNGDKERQFPMEVVLGDNRISGAFGDMTFENGIAKFTLKDNESKTAAGLPSGISYTVTETDSYYHTATYTGETGTIPVGATAEATVTNHRTRTGGGGGGSTSDRINVSVNKVWKMNITSQMPESVTVELIRDGQVYETVTLSAANNWRYTWRGLNDRYSWSVREIDIPVGFASSTSHQGNSWTITNEETIPTIPENVPDYTPKTGDPTRTMMWLILFLLSLAGGAALLATKKRGRGRETK